MKERKAVIEELQEMLRQRPIAKHWCLREMDGPPVFGAFFDAEELGGRIHVSPQLAGIDIRRCPASDHVRTDSVPTPTYQVYLDTLAELRKRSRILFKS